MEKFNLYAVLDKELLKDKDLIDAAKELIDSEVELIQYRDKVSQEDMILKNAERLRKLKLFLIINDYPKIAKSVDAYGVHLGQDDMDIISARELVGNDKIIGISTHNLKDALKAENAGADYIGIGPVFATSTKKDVVPVGIEILKEVSGNIKIPVFAIGGITLNNIDTVLKAGIKRVAVASAILCSHNIKKTVNEFYKKLCKEAPPPNIINRSTVELARNKNLCGILHIPMGGGGASLYT